MVGGPVDFIPKYSLFYTNNGQKKMYELLGVRTQAEFAKFLGQDGGISNDDMDMMILAGLVWQHPEITLEEVQELIETEFYIKQGGDLEIENDKIIEAFVNSGLLNKERIEYANKVKKLRVLNANNELDDKLKEADMGNRY